MGSLLVRTIGFPALLIHGDTLVWDRWHWLSTRLPITGRQPRVLDVGCGNGAFTIGAARRGYLALGMTIAANDARKAEERAALCATPHVRFETVDARALDERRDFAAAFDVVLCTEVIEHVLDDRKLVRDMADCLAPGGRLLLTTPNVDFKPITASDTAPPSAYEDGGHVRRGYTEQNLRELCRDAGLDVDDIGFCEGVLSQKVTAMWRLLSRHIHPVIGWLGILGLRSLPMFLDPALTRLLHWPGFSIYLEAHRPDARSGERPLHAGLTRGRAARQQAQGGASLHPSTRINHASLAHLLVRSKESNQPPSGRHGSGMPFWRLKRGRACGPRTVQGSRARVPTRHGEPSNQESTKRVVIRMNRGDVAI